MDLLSIVLLEELLSILGDHLGGVPYKFRW
jgi:hypothetical protein